MDQMEHIKTYQNNNRSHESNTVSAWWDDFIPTEVTFFHRGIVV
jgi:hypothetical protein